ncbi:MAG TPA: hypothetical protein GXX19_05050 [Syntrophomonadaceae bacterium]|nr:hypothetical protein [Syntrophomonadaceae bacterium]
MGFRWRRTIQIHRPPGTTRRTGPPGLDHRPRRSPLPIQPEPEGQRNADYCIKSVVAISVNTAIENFDNAYDWRGQKWQMIENGELVI